VRRFTAQRSKDMVQYGHLTHLKMLDVADQLEQAVILFNSNVGRAAFGNCVNG
jgi:hypothetical protein